MPDTIREVPLQQVMEEVGLGEEEFAVRLDYLEISEASSAALHSARALFAEFREPVIDKLYEFLLQSEPVRARLGDKGRIARLKHLQAAYFDSIVEGKTDLAYAESRLRIGLAHYRVGLEPKWFVGAWRKYLSELLVRFHERMGGGPDFVALVDALMKHVMLDTSIAIEAYFNEGRRALEEAHAYAEQVIATRTVGVAVVNDQLKIDSVNRALCILFGVVADDLVGLELSDELIPIGGLTQMVRQVHAGSPAVNEWLVRTASAAGTRSFEVSIAKLPYHASERTLVTLTDVTDRIRTQERCNRLGKVMDTIDELVLVVERKSLRIVDSSHRMQSLLGYAPDELHHSGLDHVASGIGSGTSLFDLLRSEEQFPLQVPLVLKRKDGGEVRVTARTSLSQGLGKAFVVLVARDGHANDARAGEMLQSILVGVARGAHITETLGHIVAALEHALPGLRCAIVAVNPRKFQVELVAAPGLGDAYTERMQGLILGPEIGSCGWSFFAAREVYAYEGDDPVWKGSPALPIVEGVRASWSTPIMGRQGRVTGVLEAYGREAREPCSHEHGLLQRASAIAAVAIQRWLLEREVESAAEEMELRIDQRTQELEHATRELEAYSYSLAHDLRGPLRAASGFSRLLVEEHSADLPAEARRYLDRVASSTERAGSLVSDMLKLFRLGRVEMRRERLDLTSMAKTIAASIQEREPQRRVAWRISPDLEAWGDAGLVQMVLTNLLDNAWKYSSPREEAQIEVGTMDSKTSETVVYVRDNGVGFDMTFAPRLFGLCQRLHSENEFPGNGLGLAIVRRVVERHGGRVWVLAERDNGATFHFAMPNAPAALGRLAQAA